MTSHAMARRYASDLTLIQKYLLKQHIDRKLPLIRKEDSAPRRVLLGRDFIKYTQKTGCAATKFPTHTMLTELGRAVVCAVLADEAEAAITEPNFIENLSTPPQIKSPPVTPIDAPTTAEMTLAAGWKASRFD